MWNSTFEPDLRERNNDLWRAYTRKVLLMQSLYESRVYCPRSRPKGEIPRKHSNSGAGAAVVWTITSIGIWTYPCFPQFQTSQCIRQRILHMTTFQHQQSNFLNRRHPRYTGPVVWLTHPRFPLKRKVCPVSIPLTKRKNYCKDPKSLNTRVFAMKGNIMTQLLFCLVLMLTR